MKQELSRKHLLGIDDISKEDMELIFETADNFKEVINRPIKKVPSLRDITVANVFFENSTRTRISFELAEKRLFETETHAVTHGTSQDSAQHVSAPLVRGNHAVG